MRSLLLAALPLFLTGCVVNVRDAGPTEYVKKDIERDKSEMVKVDLHMGVGELRLDGGAKKLMEGDFSYNLPSWKPDIRYTTTGVHGYLTVDQPDTHSIGNNVHSKWDMRLANDVPIDMQVKFGVGEAHLNLGALNLRSVDVNIGVGEIHMDLRGEPKRNYDVHIRGGVGEATVYLPSNVGIYADAHGGIGGLDIRGLHKQGGHWESEDYDKAKVKVNVDVRGGVGEIHLIAE